MPTIYLPSGCYIDTCKGAMPARLAFAHHQSMFVQQSPLWAGPPEYSLCPYTGAMRRPFEPIDPPTPAPEEPKP